MKHTTLIRLMMGLACSVALIVNTRLGNWSACAWIILCFVWSWSAMNERETLEKSMELNEKIFTEWKKCFKIEE